MKKVFNNEKSANYFRKELDSGKFQTICLQDLLNSQMDTSQLSLESRRFLKFYNQRNKVKVQFFITIVSIEMFKHNFGSSDFSTEGQKNNDNWIVESDGLIGVMSSNPMIVLTEENNFNEKLIQFAIEYFNHCFAFYTKNYHKIDFIDKQVKDWKKKKFVKNNSFVSSTSLMAKLRKKLTTQYLEFKANLNNTYF